MTAASCVEIAGDTPYPCVRVVQLRGVIGRTAAKLVVVKASRNQDLAVLKQSRCVKTMEVAETAGVGPTRSLRLSRHASGWAQHDDGRAYQPNECKYQTNAKSNMILNV